MIMDQDNEWQTFLETGKDVPKAVKPREVTDVHEQLKAKYPGMPIPSPVSEISPRQQRAISHKKGER